MGVLVGLRRTLDAMNGSTPPDRLNSITARLEDHDCTPDDDDDDDDDDDEDEAETVLEVAPPAAAQHAEDFDWGAPREEPKQTADSFDWGAPRGEAVQSSGSVPSNGVAAAAPKKLRPFKRQVARPLLDIFQTREATDLIELLQARRLPGLTSIENMQLIAILSALQVVF